VQSEPSASVSDDTRSRPTKFYDYFVLTPAIYASPHDHVRAELGVYERFLADPGESGFRLADWILAYTRFVPIATEEEGLPSQPPMRGALLRVEGSVSAPTSFRSQLRSIITVPRLRVFADRAFLDRTLVVGVNTFGERYFTHYRSAEGGNPNPFARMAFEVTLDYSMPFWRPFSIGALADTSYTWYYNIDSASPLPYGNVGDYQFPEQPIQQRYGAEFRARYTFPAWNDVRAFASLAYSIGDNTVLHDGVQHLYYAFYRRASEVYLTLSARY
jgi:hypothetical protein